MYELWGGGAPFRRDEKGRVFDSANTQVRLLGASASVLTALATDPVYKNTKVVWGPGIVIPSLFDFRFSPWTSYTLRLHTSVERNTLIGLSIACRRFF